MVVLGERVSVQVDGNSEVKGRTAAKASSFGSVPLTLNRSIPRWAGEETAANRTNPEGRNSMAKMPLGGGPPLGLHEAVWSDSYLRLGKLPFAHEEQGHCSQRLDIHGRLCGIVIGEAAEEAQAVGDLFQSGQPEHGDDPLVRAFGRDNALAMSSR